MIQISCDAPNVMSAHVTDVMGGHLIHLYLHPDILDTINWVKQHKAQLEREQQIRAQDPAAQELFTQYETYLNLTYNK
jgi:hypothetical protein